MLIKYDNSSCLVLYSVSSSVANKPQNWSTFDPVLTTVRKTGAPRFGERSATHVSLWANWSGAALWEVIAPRFGDIFVGNTGLYHRPISEDNHCTRFNSNINVVCFPACILWIVILHPLKMCFSDIYYTDTFSTFISVFRIYPFARLVHGIPDEVKLCCA